MLQWDNKETKAPVQSPQIHQPTNPLCIRCDEADGLEICLFPLLVSGCHTVAGGNLKASDGFPSLLRVSVVTSGTRAVTISIQLLDGLPGGPVAMVSEGSNRNRIVIIAPHHPSLWAGHRFRYTTVKLSKQHLGEESVHQLTAPLFLSSSLIARTSVPCTACLEIVGLE